MFRTVSRSTATPSSATRTHSTSDWQTQAETEGSEEYTSVTPSQTTYSSSGWNSSGTGGTYKSGTSSSYGDNNRLVNVNNVKGSQQQVPSLPNITDALQEMQSIRCEVLRLETMIHTVQAHSTRAQQAGVSQQSGRGQSSGRNARASNLNVEYVHELAPAHPSSGQLQRPSTMPGPNPFSRSALEATKPWYGVTVSKRMYKTSPIHQLFIEAEKRKMIPRNKTWQSLASPSLSHPNSRTEAVRLSAILDSLLSNRTRFMERIQDFYCSPGIADVVGVPNFDYEALGEELFIYDIIFGDLINKARLECAERAELLERIRSRLMELFFVASAHMAQLESQHKKDLHFMTTAEEMQNTVTHTAITLKDQLSSSTSESASFKREVDKLKNKLHEITREHEIEIEKMKDQDNENKWLIRDLEKRSAIANDEKVTLADAYEEQLSAARKELDHISQKLKDAEMRLVKVDTFEQGVMTVHPARAVDMSQDIVVKKAPEDSGRSSLAHLLGPGSTTGRIRSKLWLSRLASYLYMDKSEHDLKSSTLPTHIKTFADFTYDFHLQMFGRRSVAEQHMKSLIATVRNFVKDSSRCHYFARLCGIHPTDPEVSLNSQVFFLYALSSLQHSVGVNNFPWHSAYDDGSCWITEEQAVECVFLILSGVRGEAQRQAAEKIHSLAVTEVLALGQERRIVDLDLYLQEMVNAWEAECLQEGIALLEEATSACGLIDPTVPPRQATEQLNFSSFDDFVKLIQEIEPELEENTIYPMFKTAVHVGGDESGHVTLKSMLYVLQSNWLGPWKFPERPRWFFIDPVTKKAKNKNLHAVVARAWKEHEGWVRNSIKDVGLLGVPIQRLNDSLSALVNELGEGANSDHAFDLLRRLMDSVDRELLTIKRKSKMYRPAGNAGHSSPR